MTVCGASVKHALKTTLFIFITITFVSSCASGDNQSPQPLGALSVTRVPQIRLADVEAIEIIQSRGSTLEVSVIVRGSHKSQCEQIDKIQQSRVNRDFLIAIESRLVPTSKCTSDLVPFEQALALDVNGLPPGTYYAEVNGLRGSFTIPAPSDPDPENAVISGTLWLDTCPENLLAGEVDNPSTGICIELGDGLKVANDILDNGESGVENVIVNLGAGRCPSVGLASTITDSNGVFLFAGLRSGKYCVSIDSLNPQNSQQLFDGLWSNIEFGATAEKEVDIQSGQVQQDINFGWQRTAQPRIILPREDPCTDKALFMEDVTIPDGSILFSGQEFTKTWRLRNIGSCSWDEGYTLVLVEGEAMNALESIPILSVVNPGDDIELSVTMTAPAIPGAYESAWKLQNQNAILFGIGPGSNQAFWVKINVETSD